MEAKVNNSFHSEWEISGLNCPIDPHANAAMTGGFGLGAERHNDSNRWGESSAFSGM